MLLSAVRLQGPIEWRREKVFLLKLIEGGLSDVGSSIQSESYGHHMASNTSKGSVTFNPGYQGGG